MYSYMRQMSPWQYCKDCKKITQVDDRGFCRHHSMRGTRYRVDTIRRYERRDGEQLNDLRDMLDELMGTQTKRFQPITAIIIGYVYDNMRCFYGQNSRHCITDTIIYKHLTRKIGLCDKCGANKPEYWIRIRTIIAP